MSTRSTLWHSDDLHLYREGMDDENVYLEMRSRFFEELVIKIPLTAWKEMRKQTIQPAERYLDLTNEELLREAASEVDRHRLWLEERKDSRFASGAGILVYGPPDSSRQEMIEHYFSFYRRRRDTTAGEADADQ